jgi:hypothetical protein
MGRQLRHGWVKSPPMPKGVEHTWDKVYFRVSEIVMKPLMPTGVEHEKGLDSGVAQAIVIKPLIPEGVEHGTDNAEILFNEAGVVKPLMPEGVVSVVLRTWG